MNKSVAVVILHYLLEDETKRCIESFLKKINTNKYAIIVVDNASNNGSIERLMTFYADNKSIHFVCNDKNLGFSAGNNRGIMYARKLDDFDFIVVSNNDIILKSENLVKILSHEYDVSSFAVAGPKIINLDKSDHSNCNPLNYKLPEIQYFGNVNTKITEALENGFKNPRNIIKYCYYKIKKIGYKAYYFYNKNRIIRNIKDVDKFNSRYYKNDDNEYNIILHGCFLIFSKKFFEYYDGFDERLFLYHEESLLYYLLAKKDLISVYLPAIEVIHKHAKATRQIKDKDFFVKNYCESERKVNKIIYFS